MQWYDDAIVFITQIQWCTYIPLHLPAGAHACCILFRKRYKTDISEAFGRCRVASACKRRPTAPVWLSTVAPYDEPGTELASVVVCLLVGLVLHAADVVADWAPCAIEHFVIVVCRTNVKQHELRKKSVGHILADTGHVTASPGKSISNVRFLCQVLWHSILVSNFAKCWPIFKILSPADLAVNFWKRNN